MATQDLELRFGQLVRVVQDVGGRSHLADVVQECRQPELAQERALDAEAARLPHGQDRHVDHVCERVAVVFLERRQREQGRAVLRDFMRERIDDFPPRRPRRAFPPFSRCPTSVSATDHRVLVEAGGTWRCPRSRHLAFLFGLQAADPDVLQAGQRGGRLRCRIDGAERLDQLRELVELHTLIDDDAFDLHVLQLPGQLAHALGGARHGDVSDHEVLADDTDGDGRGVREDERQRFSQCRHTASDQRDESGAYN